MRLIPDGDQELHIVYTPDESDTREDKNRAAEDANMRCVRCRKRIGYDGLYYDVSESTGGIKVIHAACVPWRYGEER